MEVRIEQFVGLDQGRDEPLIAQTHAPEAENVMTTGGRLSVCPRETAYTSEPLNGGIGSLAAFYPRVDGVTKKRLVAVNEARVAEWTDGGWATRYEGAGRAQASTLNYQHNGEDILLLADGVRPVLRWDGGEMTALNGCDRAFSQLALHYERVWGSGLAGEPDAVYWSRAFDPEDWTGDALNPDAGGGVVLIPSWNGGRVVAIRTLFGDVLVFKDEDLFRIVGTYPGNYEIVRVHGIVGPIAPGSIVAAADACYFLSKEGLCAYNGVTAQPIGGQDAKGVFARVTREAAHRAAAAIHCGTLYLALPLDGAMDNNAILEINLSRGSYLLRTGIHAACLMPFDDDLIYADGAGSVMRYGVHARTGDALGRAAYWRTPWQDMGKPGVRKRFERLNMTASGTIDLTLATERGALTRRVKLGDRQRPVSVPLGLSGRRWSLTIKNVSGGAFTVSPGLSIQYDADE